jgi:hypothetical protein
MKQASGKLGLVRRNLYSLGNINFHFIKVNGQEGTSMIQYLYYNQYILFTYEIARNKIGYIFVCIRNLIESTESYF